MATNVEEMEQQRTAKVAVARAEIEKAEKAKLAKADKTAKAERERVKKASAERTQKEAAKPKPVAKKSVQPDKRKVTDKELLVVKNFATADASKSGVVKAVRQSGVSAKGSRIRSMFDVVAKAGKAKPKK